MNDWLETVRLRMKRGRQILIDREDAPILQLQCVIDALPRIAAVLWALELAEETVRLLEQKHPQDLRPRRALEAARSWAAGEIRMPAAKRAILNCHAAAKETQDAADIAHYHAVGQACAAVHTVRHAVGYCMYDLTALARENGVNERLTERCLHYAERLAYWTEHWKKSEGECAEFLKPPSGRE